MAHWIIAVDEVPKSCTVWDWVLARTDIVTAMQDVRRTLDTGPVMEVPVTLDLEQLRANYLACAREVGELRGFVTADERRNAYVGFSLTWNPHHIDALPPFFSTLGTPRNRSGEFFALARPSEQPQRRNSYWDAWGFNAIHPVIGRHFAPLIERFTLSPIRSRAATLRHAERERITSPEFMWHLDESPFCNLRVNIPLFTAPEYRMEIDSEYRHPSMPTRVAGQGIRWRGHLAPGKAWSWDTQLAHRVHAEGAPQVDRAHLVLGFSPWFDWDETGRRWISNRYYGTVHPLDLVADGRVFR